MVVLQKYSCIWQDLNSCHKLLKQQELLENDVRDHRATIENLYSLSKAFYDADHFDKVNIKARQDSLQKRYVALKVRQFF